MALLGSSSRPWALPRGSASRNVAPGQWDVLFILIAWWLWQTSGLHTHSIVSFRELLQELSCLCARLLCGSGSCSSDVFGGYLYLLCSQRNAAVLCMPIKQHGGASSSLHSHSSKVLPELVLKQLWANFCVCKTITWL